MITKRWKIRVIKRLAESREQRKNNKAAVYFNYEQGIRKHFSIWKTHAAVQDSDEKGIEAKMERVVKMGKKRALSLLIMQAYSLKLRKR